MALTEEQQEALKMAADKLDALIEQIEELTEKIDRQADGLFAIAASNGALLSAILGDEEDDSEESESEETFEGLDNEKGSITHAKSEK